LSDISVAAKPQGIGAIADQHGVNLCDRRSPVEPVSWRDALRPGSIVSIWQIAPVFLAPEDWT